MNEPRARITHELKTWPEFFKQIRNGRKKFELRRNDRDFKVGDQLLLKEWNPQMEQKAGGFGPMGYTGRELLVRVDYIMKAESIFFGGTTLPLAAGYVIMSVSLVS